MSIDATAASSDLGGRGDKPGPRRLYGAAALAAVALAAILVIALRPGSGTKAPTLRAVHLALTRVYGHPPKAIAENIPLPPKITTPVASETHPDLHQNQGVPVLAKLPAGQVTVFMDGPALPYDLPEEVAEHKVSLYANVPGRFEIQFKAAHGTVPLAASQFTIATFKGQLIAPKVTLANGKPLPAEAPAGRTLTLRATAKVPEGDGTIRWSPVGEKILVGYFWTTEFD